MIGIAQRSYVRRRRGFSVRDWGALPEDLSAALDVLERAMYLLGRPDAWRADATAEDAAAGVYSMTTAISQAAADLWAPENPRYAVWGSVETLATESRKQCDRALPAYTSDRWERPSSRNDVILVMRAGWYFTFQRVYGGGRRVRAY